MIHTQRDGVWGIKDGNSTGWEIHATRPYHWHMVPSGESILTAEQRQAILRFDTCKLANAIERLGFRLRNEGFTRPGLRCVTGGSPRVLGYAVTSCVKTTDPPMHGYRTYYDLTDWWSVIETRPHPRVAVIQDVDAEPGTGAVLSDVHANVLQALGCCGVVTNGSVRNVEALAVMRFPAFSQSVSMSHAYVHMVNFGGPVEILGLRIAPSDLIYVDVHGALLLPSGEIDDIIRIAQELASKEAAVITLCLSGNVSIHRIREAVKDL